MVIIQFKDAEQNCDKSNAGGAELGAAWRERTSGDEPKDYLSVLLDDPGFAEPIRAAFFENSEEGTGVLVWGRR